MARLSGRPDTGVFIAWDEEKVNVERRDAGTVRDRTVVVGRKIIVKLALWSNEVSDQTVEAAERYVAQECASGNAYTQPNMRVKVYTESSKRP